MSPAPCGCDLRERARTESDPRGAASLDADGAACQALWRCPRVTAPDDRTELPAACARALDAVHKLCGVDTAAGDPSEFRECPGLAARQPEAHEVAALLGWYRKGQLHLRVPHPSGALVSAIDTVESALAAREADEMRRLRAESESRRG